VQRVLGIDLGTTNSVVAYIRRGEAEIVPNRQNQDSTPSVVARGRRGELLVGAPARARQGVPDADVIRSVKRFMGRRFASPDVQAVLERVPYRVTEGPDGEVDIWFGGRAYTPTEISSLILGRLKAEAEERTGLTFPRAVITVPAYFGERQVAATREAGRMAGFEVLKVLDEPTAAALAYGYLRESPDEDQTVLVFDLGGGTFDISVLILVGGVFTVLCVEGDNLLGGDDFDRLIAERVFAETLGDQGRDLAADQDAVHPVITAAEGAKIALSAEDETEIILPAVGRPPIAVLHEVSRAEFTELIRPRVDAAMELVERAVSGADLEPAEIDQVLLVGGSTAIPYVQERLAAMFGRDKIRKDIHPMKAVALGAAFQSGLVTEVDCPHCQQQSPVSADDCTACGRSLLPPAKLSCPTCFRYSDAGTAVCPRCDTDLTGTGAPAAAPVVVEPVVLGKAPADPTEGGLRCLNCSTVNVAGATECANCEEPIEPPSEITAKSLGIELHDGGMAVILPKGTPFPTPQDQPTGRDFATAVTDQRRLEIVVYEGDDEVAARNELCGYITMPLPPGLVRNSPINVAFGYDRSRTLTVEVKVRAVGEQPRRVQIQRSGRIGPEDLQRLERQREAVTRFVDRWTDELAPTEAAVFYQMIEEIEQMMAGGAGVSAAVTELVERADRLVALVSDVRGSSAYLSAVRAAVGKYLSEADRDELARFAAAVEEARGRADWGAAAVIAQQARDYIDEFGPDLRDLVFCRAFAVQGSLSAALSHRILGRTREFDEAFDRGDRAGMDQAAAALAELAADVRDELDENPYDVTAVTKPKLAGG
jgi:molecular chaperone DnaK (HSP70)